MRGIELPIVIVYLAICIGIGLYGRKLTAQDSSRTYLNAGANFGLFVNGMAMYAAFCTGGTMLGNMGLSYGMGWGYVTTMAMGVGIGFLLTAFFVAKPFRNMGIVTVPEFLKVRFQSKFIDVVVPIILIATLTAYVVAQMKVVGMIGELLLGIPYNWAVLGIGLIYVLYVLIGGMWAITITDLIQGAFMLFITVAAGILVLKFGGGAAELYTKAQALRPAWTAATSLPLSSFIGAVLVWATVTCVLPHTVMRIFAAKNEVTGRRSLAMGVSLYAFTSIVTLIFVAAAAIIIKGGIDIPNNDTAFLVVIETLFPRWLIGVAYAAIFAAVMSSVDAMLLAIGAAASFDLYKTLRPQTPDRQILSINKYCILIFGVLSLALALRPPEFLTLLYSAAMGLLASGLFFPAVLGVWWKRMNKWGAIAGILGGSLTFLICMFGLDLPTLSEINYALPVSLILCIVVSLATSAPSEDELARITIAHEREYKPGELGEEVS